VAKVVIKHPKAGRAFKKRVLYASGYGDPADTSFTSTLGDQHAHTVDGETLFHFPKQKGKGGTKRRRWLIRFNDKHRILTPGDVGTLLVTGSVSTPSDPRTINLEFVDRAPPFIQIDLSIEDGEQGIDGDGFVVFGSMSHPVASVSMNSVGADFVYEDWELDFWVAQFPTLTPGTYYLLAVDSNNHSDARHNLGVI
jgi:hypothetical protein